MRIKCTSWPSKFWASETKDVEKDPVNLVSFTSRTNLEAEMLNIASLAESNTCVAPDNFAETKAPGKRYLGILFALLASIVCSFGVFIAKKLAPRYDPFNLTLWKFQGCLFPPLFSLVYQLIVHRKTDMFDDIWPLKCSQKRTYFLICLRTVGSTSAVIGQFYSLRYISLADSSVIRFSTPVLVVVVAYFILHEPFSIVQLMMGISSIVGIIILARPPFLTGGVGFDDENLIGVAFAVGSMVSTTCYLCCLRYLRGIKVILLVFCNGIISCLVCTVVLLFTGQFQLPQGIWDWALAMLLILLTFICNWLITSALKFEKSGIVSLVRCLDVAFSFFYQFIFMSVIPDLYSILGALVVVLSVAMIAVQKWVSELPKNDPMRIRFRFLLK